MKFIEDINIKNKKVLIRVDYNVPMQNGEIVNDYRILRSLETIQYCLDNNASIVLMSHLGRPSGVNKEELSLEPVLWHLEDILEQEIHFADDCISEEAMSMSKKLKPKEILLLENLRFHDEEIKNDYKFSEQLSKMGDIYINDAFGTAHRSHASNVGVASFLSRKGFGFLIRDEIKYLKTSMEDSKKPLTFIIGGSKISTKISLIENIINKADVILVGGAMAFTFLKALGHEVGKSLIEDDYISTAKNIIQKCKENKTTLQFPVDVVCSKDMDSNEQIDVKPIDSIDEDDIGLDIGPETCINYDMFIESSKTLIWNGPLGLFENPYFSTGTQAIANSLINTKNNHNAVVVIGGGDTVTAIDSFNSELDYSHISTGGGSALELLSGKKLPALTALED